MQEIWKDIKNYEGAYQVSNLGRIRSLTRKVKTFNGFRTAKGQLLKPLKTNRNYFRVNLKQSQEDKYISIHRLVAETFIPNPNNYSTVNHIDGDTFNNRVDNLEWCTQSHNIKYAYKYGNAKPTKGCFQKGCVPHNRKKINQYSKNKEFICSYISIKEASDFTHIKRSSINNCLTKRCKTAGGFIWEYAD